MAKPRVQTLGHAPANGSTPTGSEFAATAPNSGIGPISLRTSAYGPTARPAVTDPAPAVAVTTAFTPALTCFVVMPNVTDVAPGGTFTDAGTTTSGELDFNFTTNPLLPAVALS